MENICKKYVDRSIQWEDSLKFFKRIGENERFDLLSEHLKKMNPSSGYRILAKLIEEGFFKVVLTTNFGFMLEEALNSTQLVLDKDYFVCVVGAEKEDVLIRKLEDESMIRIVKLPFADMEPFRFGRNLEKCLKKLTKTGVLLVGYSEMDKDFLNFLSDEGESVWWINNKKVTADQNIQRKNPDEYMLDEKIYRVLINRKSHENFIWGENGESDIFFEKIFKEISVRDIESFCDFFRFGAKRYRKMKDLFEPPYQYEEMKHKLEKYKVLLILGEAHLGKTYTALNLLFDYYVKGFDVDFKSELLRKEIQHEIMYKWEDLLKSNTVLYFEDPFGKTELENVQTFRSELKRIIERIQNSESMVIVTSRLNIFKEIGDPNEFPMIVELMKQDRSYDLEKRKRIIDRYVAVYEPEWQKLVNNIVCGKPLKEYIALKLTEPHNIELLFEKSLKTGSVESLLEKVDESKEILDVFKQEIRMSNMAEKIFFYVCYIFEGWGDFETARNSYYKILGCFDLDGHVNDFSKLMQKYDFRVETYRGHWVWLKIRFSHPDFSRAIEESFRENIIIIGKILQRLAHEESSVARRSVVYTVGKNFEELTERDRKLLFNLAKDRSVPVRQSVADTVCEYFEKLPEEFRRLLFELAAEEQPFIRSRVISAIGRNFEKLPEEYRSLLFVLARDRDATVKLLHAHRIGKYFEKLTEEYRSLLFELPKDENVMVIIYHFYIICQNFDKLPEKYRKFLFVLARNKNPIARWGVASIVGECFSRLPEEYRSLLLELAGDKNAVVRGNIARIIGNNFEKLPEKYRNLLFDLAKDYEASVKESVAEVIDMYFEELPEEYKSLLLVLARDENADVRKSVVYTLLYNFENLPDKYRNLFFVLAKDENADVRKSVIHALGRNFEGLPEEYKRILLDLSEDESPHVRAKVALFVGHNYEKLPQAYQRILLKFKSDSPVLDLLRKWIDRNEPDERQKKIIRILKSEIDL